MEPRRRKKNRLKDHDYGCPGYYFLTACIRNKADLLGEIAAEINISRGDSVGRDAPGAPLAYCRAILPLEAGFKSRGRFPGALTLGTDSDIIKAINFVFGGAYMYGEES